MEEKEKKNEITLQKQRRLLLEDLIQHIQNTIIQNNIQNEDKRKIAIYSRIAEYTYYSEVSIRKFLTGMIPKDMETFINGILAYGTYLKMEEKYLEKFATEYTMASSAIIIQNKEMNRIWHNLTLQNLHAIIRRKQITTSFDNFIQGDDTICYVYGYKLTGKTKSVLAYAYDLIQERSPFEYLIWNDIAIHQDVEKKVIQSTLKMIQKGNPVEQLDETAQLDLFKEAISNHNMLYVIDLQGNPFTKETFLFVKMLAQYVKVIVIAVESYETISEFLTEGVCTISFNIGMEKEELYQMIKAQFSLQKLLEIDPTIIDDIHQLTGGFPFAALYLCKKLIEENKYGKSFQEVLTEFQTYNNHGYNFLNEKMIDQTWNTLDPLAKHILFICSQYSYSLSLQSIAYVCQVDMTQEAWKKALNSCYQSGLITHIIGLRPRCKMNHFISTLIKNKNKYHTSMEQDFKLMVSYYVEMTAKIGICYYDLDRMKVLDESEEYDVLQEIMQQLFQQKMYEEYIKIGVNLKYYAYVRGYWNIGENSIILKRYQAAKETQNPNEQLRALCEYINIMAKQRNEKEAKKYLVIAEEIVAQNQEALENAILILFNHVNALYLFHITENYTLAWKFWEQNEKIYQTDMSQYRKMVNTLWMDKCRFELDGNLETLYEDVQEDYHYAKEHQFTRGIIDYELLLSNILLKRYGVQKQKLILDEIEIRLLQTQMRLEKESILDVRNEAEIYRQFTILYHYLNQEEKKDVSFKKACEKYKRLHALQSITLLEQEIKGLS